MRLTTVVVLCWSLSACASDGSIDTLFDPCAPLTIVVGPGALDTEEQSVRDALLGWSAVIPTQLTVRRGTVDDGALPIYFEPGEAFFRAMYLDESGEIYISRDKLAPEDLPIAIAHEVGHAFGLEHVAKEERLSIMNSGNLEIWPAEVEADQLRSLWPSCGDAASNP